MFMLANIYPAAAAGWAFLYLLLGGSFSGAVVVFIISVASLSSASRRASTGSVTPTKI